MSCRSSALVRIKRRQLAGFGLVELLVSVSIMAIILATIMSRQDAFNGAVLLRNQAYEIALEAREVQLGAVSAINTAGEFRNIYGLYFDTNSSLNNQYQVYRDNGGSIGIYDAGEEFGGLIPGGSASKLDSRFVIDDILIDEGAGLVSNSKASVVFERPNFDAVVYDDGDVLAPDATIQIVVRRVGTSGTGCGEVRKVEITSTGQIAVLTCP